MEGGVQGVGDSGIKFGTRTDQQRSNLVISKKAGYMQWGPLVLVFEIGRRTLIGIENIGQIQVEGGRMRERGGRGVSSQRGGVPGRCPCGPPRRHRGGAGSSAVSPPSLAISDRLPWGEPM